MLEPIFTDRNEAARALIVPGDAESLKKARDSALLHRATELAIESAFMHGKDLPVGAVAANNLWITGRYYASDKRLDWPPVHAEVMALIDSEYNRDVSLGPDTLMVTVEPCNNCQDFIAGQDWGHITRVGFGLTRNEMAEKGLVKPHNETIFERVARLGYPYEVFKVEDEQLHKAGGIILDFVRRDTATGLTTIDTQGLTAALTALNLAA